MVPVRSITARPPTSATDGRNAWPPLVAARACVPCPGAGRACLDAPLSPFADGAAAALFVDGGDGGVETDPLTATRLATGRSGFVFTDAGMAAARLAEDDVVRAAEDADDDDWDAALCSAAELFSAFESPAAGELFFILEFCSAFELFIAAPELLMAAVPLDGRTTSSANPADKNPMIKSVKIFLNTTEL